MTPGAIAILVVTLVLTAMVGTIGYLLKTRFDSQDKTLAELSTKVTTIETAGAANTVAIARLTESQRYVVANQTTISQAQERLVSEADDLEDVNDQLQDATRSLRGRMDAHEEYHKRLLQNRADRD